MHCLVVGGSVSVLFHNHCKKILWSGLRDYYLTWKFQNWRPLYDQPIVWNIQDSRIFVEEPMERLRESEVAQLATAKKQYFSRCNRAVVHMRSYQYLIADGRGESQFSLKMWPIGGQPHTRAGLIPRTSWAAQSALNKERNSNKRRNGKVGWESMGGGSQWLQEELGRGEYAQNTMYTIFKELIKTLLKICLIKWLYKSEKNIFLNYPLLEEYFLPKYSLWGDFQNPTI